MILSVDMGFKNYGVSLWKKDKPIKLELIQTKKNKKHKGLASVELIRRHKHMSQQLRGLIKQYHPRLLVGEMPTFGAQSSHAAVAMTMATATTLTLCDAFGIPALWYTPTEIKRHYTGDPHATKQMIMEKVCLQHNWATLSKRIKDKRDPKGYRIQTLYCVGKTQFSAGRFEHIADSIAAYYTAKYFYEQRRKQCLKRKRIAVV